MLQPSGWGSVALQALHLEEVQLDRRLAAKERYEDPHLAFIQVDLIHDADEVDEGPVDDAHALADDEADAHARLLRLHLAEDALDLRLFQRHRPHARADEAGHAGRVAHDEPGAARLRGVLLQQIHVNQDVAGEDLARDGAAHAAVHLDLVHRRHEDAMNEVAGVHRCDAVLEVGLDAVLVAGVGVDDVPGAALLEVIVLGERLLLALGQGRLQLGRLRAPARFAAGWVCFHYLYLRSRRSISQLKNTSMLPSRTPTLTATMMTTVVR